MRIAVRRFQDTDAPAVDRLNRRLDASSAGHRLYKEDLTRNPEADLDVRPVNDALYVAADDEEIRGGAWLREQFFRVEGERFRVGWIKYPVAESLVDSRFAGVPASMVFQFLRLQPRLLALGMGGHDAPFARLVAGIGWSPSTIPLFFRVVRPFNVLRGLAYARRRRSMRLAMDLAAYTGLGWLVHRALDARAIRRHARSRVETHVESAFTPWADPIWEACRDRYSVLAVRDARALDHLYPPSVPGLDRLRVERAGENIGWATVQILPRNESNVTYFGSLTVGLVTDLLARPSDANAVLASGVSHLESLDADLIIAYFTHEAWIDAALTLRFRKGPSNFAFYMSPEAAALFAGEEGVTRRCHFMRHSFGEDALLDEPHYE